ncbi:MAG: RHS repeat-associated core domain-containing protein [Prevotellaceae bacterium]|nr:RHS repeat-associated core domain-containing protein [Candidatus Minthosoma equi]
MKNLKREILLCMPASMDVQTHKYNGKELDLMHGLNEYDYGARQYDPAIAQFTTVDPLCEKYYHISPYAYCGGNPVNRVDPDGKDWYKVRATGQYVYDKSLNSSNFTTKYGWKNYMYIGKNAETPNGRYLSLFGENMDASSSHAQLYKHIENAFVNYENVRNGKGAYDSEDFNIGKKYKEDLYANNYNVYPMEYEGAKVRYTVLRSDTKTNNMIGYVETFMKKVDEKNNLPSGVIIAIKPVRQGSEGSTIVRITFEDIIKAQAFLDKYNQEFGTNIRITKYENSYK